MKIETCDRFYYYWNEFIEYSTLRNSFLFSGDRKKVRFRFLSDNHIVYKVYRRDFLIKQGVEGVD